jgi:hypothetical protein
MSEDEIKLILLVLFGLSSLLWYAGRRYERYTARKQQIDKLKMELGVSDRYPGRSRRRESESNEW